MAGEKKASNVKEIIIVEDVFRFKVSIYIGWYPAQLEEEVKNAEALTTGWHWDYYIILKHNDISTLIHELNHVVQMRLEECWVDDLEVHSYLLQSLLNKVLSEDDTYFDYIPLSNYFEKEPEKEEEKTK